MTTKREESTAAGAAMAALLSAGQAPGEDMVVVDRLDVLKQKLLEAAEECLSKPELLAARRAAGDHQTEAAARINAFEMAISERDAARRREAALLEEVTSVRARFDTCRRDLDEVNRSTSRKTESLMAENASLREGMAKVEEWKTVAMGVLVFLFFYFDFNFLAWVLLLALIYDKVLKGRMTRSRRRRWTAAAEEQKRDLEAGTTSST